MTKWQFLQTLSRLKEHFKGDQQVDDAVNLLASKVEDSDLPETSSKKVAGYSDFPLPKEIKKNDFALFSDGACRGNPGPGAWGMMAQTGKGDILFEASGVEIPTTNNKMEMEGAIQALRSLLEYWEQKDLDNKAHVYLYSDSNYVVQGMNSWIDGWKKRGWKKADNKIPENLDLWQTLDELKEEFKNLKFIWVKGHAGHPQNEYCDLLANQALNEAGF